MPYLNIDDNYPDHPKVEALSDGAFRLHVAGRYPKMTALDWRIVDAAYEKLSASRGGSAKCRMNAQSPTVERDSRSGVRAVEGLSEYDGGTNQDGPGDSLLTQRVGIPGPRPTLRRSAEL